MIRVRFAPSPTGFLHIGGLRTALYNYLFAKRNKGDFILRIEDTDQTRVVPGGKENIQKTLKWAGIKWDEGPFIQSERAKIYKEHAEKLLKQGKAYKCFCTPERLTKMRKKQIAAKKPPMYDGKCRDLTKAVNKPYVVRLKIPKKGETAVKDIIHGEIKFQNAILDDQVLLKSDGFPTYHLANVVDDHLMKITHVIRGDEWLPSTPKHVLLYKAFGWKLPEFAHLPLLLNADRSKLSKRTGDVAVEEYIKKGYLPKAMINFVALLGWNPRADQEVYSLNELVKSFDLKKVNKTGAVVNFEKLKWINGEYIRAMKTAKLAEEIKPWLPKAEPKQLKYAAMLAQDRLKIFSEISELVGFLFEKPSYDSSLLQWKKMKPKEIQARLEQTCAILESITEKNWTKEKIESKMKKAIEAEKLGTGETLWPMRVALTGRKASPGPFEVAEALGRGEALQRIQYAIKKLH